MTTEQGSTGAAGARWVVRPTTVRPVGRTAILAEYPDTAAVLGAAAAVRALAPAHLVELVPAERTLLLSGFTAQDASELGRLLQQLTPAPPAGFVGEDRTINVVYDGQDLEHVAAALGMSTQALIAAHTGTTWLAAFGGFAPGFSYLLPEAELEGAEQGSGAHGSAGPGTAGPDGSAAPNWEVPRRDEPRRAVPAGAVALASRYSAIYPRSSPGGWQLIGTSQVELFDPARTPPTLLPPGTRVRFEAQRTTARVSEATGTLARAGRQVSSVQATLNRLRRTSRSRAERAIPALEMLNAGPLTLVEDTGRPGRGDIGVSSSGAFDRGALVRANLAVGNPPSAAGLEVLIGPVHLRALTSTVIAVDGGRAPLMVRRRDEDSAGVDLSATVSARRPIALDPGDLLEVGAVGCGLRIVLAVRGGIRGVQHADSATDPAPGTADPTPAGDAELGSLSRDTLSGLGPAPLEEGDVLLVRPEHGLDAVTAPSFSTRDTSDVGRDGEDPSASSGAGAQGSPSAPGSTGHRGEVERPDDDREGADRSVPDEMDGRESDSGETNTETTAETATGGTDTGGAGPARAGDDLLEVELVLGPRDQLVGDAAVTALLATRWTVREDSDRVGVRLDGTPLPVPREAGSLPSEAVVPGAVQIPPSGLPVVFGPDHPTTGGYPVIGVVTRAGLDLLAQAAPGTGVRLVTGR